MGKPLRITFKDKDYNFTILNTEPITKSTSELPISINDQNFTLIKAAKGWTPKETGESIDTSLLEEIGKAIGLRYRL